MVAESPPSKNGVAGTAGAIKALLNLSLRVYGSSDLDSLMSHILSELSRLMDVEGISILLPDHPRETLGIVWAKYPENVSPRIMKEIRVPLEGSIAGAAFKTGKPLLVPDVLQDGRHFPGVDQAIGFVTRSLLAIAMVLEDGAVGVLECVNKRHGQFQAADVELGKSLAAILALAIQRASLIESLEKTNVDLQALLDLHTGQVDRVRDERDRLLGEAESHRAFEPIVGSSPAVLSLLQRAQHALHSDITVLIQGETGTGKELLAQCLYQGGPRRTGPFMVENCATIAPGLFASELFGHVKGAFSGAINDHKGLIERAHGGTLFLDEIGDLPVEIQTGLLRALEDGYVRPVGSKEKVRSDFRLICATHKDLEKEMEAGRFRSDLYYRISVFVIHMPPLRERKEDIPRLVSVFLKEFGQTYGKTIPGLDPPVLQCLLDYPFPGNVRELRNEIESAVAVAEDGRPICLHHLSPRLRSKQCFSDPTHPQPLKAQVETLEKTLIAQALKFCGGNQTKAAKMLGLSRYGLAKKIKRYGLGGSF
ncbi:Nif-specific regulatory protein [Desulfacinum hydrothermale DSM 13146]|uniref:Nif-specific regulatory protein n=1 Tax=Desulfacinum hydrothermale DSM 13146 TaxID=1121390 RepID=A0A1W1XH31_9BACT|nr:sigma-54-dependent Fis family transcriptional regulator [Desulfacinum hydrothermale]SMC23303.1 Nif-specific regulatory protein [Desulfacinum hydrothermale DSM 13146]